MSMWSEREEFLEKEQRKKEFTRIGNNIRSLPAYEQQIAKDALRKAGINVDEAMHQSAPNRYDPHW